MSDKAYLMQDVMEWAAVLIKTVAFIVLWQRFIYHSAENKRKQQLQTGLLFVTILLVESLLVYVHQPYFPLWIPLFFFVIVGYSKAKNESVLPEATFLLLLYANIRYISYFFVNSVIEIISNKAMEGVEQAADIDTFVTTRVNFLCAATTFLFALVIAVFVCAVILLVKAPIHINWQECGYLSVLNVAGVILTIIMISIEVIKTKSGIFVLSKEKPELLWIMPVIALLLYLGELAAVYYWQEYVEYRQQSEAYYAESIEKEAIKRRLSEVENYYEQIRRVRHEMANHMTNIYGLAQNGKIDELSKYISDLDSQISSTNMHYSTGNAVTDVVINDQYKKAEEKGIRFNVLFAFDDNWGIPAMDISVILSNLLSNAIKAASKAKGDGRYVELKILDKDSVILIRCINGYINEKDDTKQCEDDKWHGIGLKNVKDIADRFDGSVSIKSGEDVFSIAVLMKKRPSVT